MMNDWAQLTESLMKKDLEKLINDLGGVRSSQISPDLVGNLLVEYKGQKKKINQLASVRTNLKRELIVQLFETKAESTIINMIINSRLGYRQSGSEKGEIYFVLDTLTEEKRKNLIIVVKQMIEKGKESLRLSRQKIRKQIKEGKLSRSEQERFEKEVEKINKNYESKIEQLLVKKSKELEFN